MFDILKFKHDSGLVFFALKSLLGIARQCSPEKFAILFLNRMWAIAF